MKNRKRKAIDGGLMWRVVQWGLIIPESTQPPVWHCYQDMLREAGAKSIARMLKAKGILCTAQPMLDPWPLDHPPD